MREMGVRGGEIENERGGEGENGRGGEIEREWERWRGRERMKEKKERMIEVD